MGSQYVTPNSKNYLKNSKCGGLAQEIVFLHQICAACANSCAHAKKSVIHCA
jgi:hypothetical protein